MKPTHLRIDDHPLPIGIDNPQPTFSWHIQSQDRDITQSACRVLVAIDPDLLELEKPDVWDSDKLNTPRSTYVRYEGPRLLGQKIFWWKVRIWDTDGTESEWSQPAYFGTGPQEDQWRADWIGAGPATEPRLLGDFEFTQEGDLADSVEVNLRSPLLRREFPAHKNVQRARIFVCGLGYYELRLNGKKVGDSVLTPSRTHYRKVALYDAYDVTGLLNEGHNALGLMLGNGWFNPARKYWGWQMQWYGNPRAILQAYLRYEDGSEETICSDQSWKTHPGPILRTCLYDGEHYDARLEQNGWDGWGTHMWHVPRPCAISAPYAFIGNGCGTCANSSCPAETSLTSVPVPPVTAHRVGPAPVYSCRGIATRRREIFDS